MKESIYCPKYGGEINSLAKLSGTARKPRQESSQMFENVYAQLACQFFWVN